MSSTPQFKLTWNNETQTIRGLVDSLDAKEYDINPTHQRNVVHLQEWKDELITSIFQPPNAIPETWWHPVYDTSGKLFYESVDGKQRTSTIYDFYKGLIKWKGRQFSEMNQQDQNEFRSHKLSLRIANRTLTPTELARIFEKLQRVKQTTLGEVLHSQRFRLTEQIEEVIIEHQSLLGKMNIKKDRHQQLEAYGKSLDYWTRYTQSEAPSFKVVCETDTVTETWHNKHTGLSETELVCFATLMARTWEAFTSPSVPKIPRKMNPGTWLPVFALLCEIEQTHHTQLKTYLNNNLLNIVDDETTWPKVGGNHGALIQRKELLKIMFEQFRSN